MKKLTYKGYAVKKDDINYDEVIKELTVKPFVIEDYSFGEDRSFPVYMQNSTHVYLPKFFGIDKFGPPDVIKEREGSDIDVQFVGKLREDQEKFVAILMEQLDKNDACVANMRTGEGKTVCALHILSKIKKKTLVILHKTFLADQWRERIKQFLPAARIGIIQQDKIDIIDKDIVIGLLQSISLREYDNKIFDEFGYIISDEVHHWGSEHFSKAFFKIGAKKMLGLSATPRRSDGLTKVISWFMGPIIEKEKTKSEIENPQVEIIEAKYENEIKIKINGKGKPNVPDLITKISLDKVRNKQIVDKIVEYAKIGRQILVLSDRRQHCTTLKEMIEKMDSGIKCGLYIGMMKLEELNKTNETCSVIIGTNQIASEGYDNPRLDCLVMTSSKSEIVQIVGRILRRVNKFRPLIIDIADKYLSGQARKRKQYYKKMKYEIIECSEREEIEEREPEVVEFREM